MIDTSDLEILEDEFEAQEFRPTSKRSSRPRSKLTGKSRANTSGIVLATHRGRYVIDIYGREVVASRVRKLRDFDIVPGDLVEISTSENSPLGESNLVRIEGIVDRKNLIKRTADDSKIATKSIAANVDQVAIITSTSSPDIQPEFILRVLKETRHNDADPLIFVTKSDLHPLDKGALPSNAKSVDILDVHTQYAEVIGALHGKNTVFIGLSGSGKSTLINRIFPHAFRKTAEVSGNGDGRHTSASSRALLLEGGGLVIDTPGIRSFGLGHLN